MLLYYITDRKQFAGNEGEKQERQLDVIEAAGRAGVDWIQLREKDLPARDLERLAGEARRRLNGSAVKLLLNSRVDVAIACGLDGVHLTSSREELTPSAARSIFASAGCAHPWIGVSCHTRQDVGLAESHGADFVVFGPVVEESTVPFASGLEALRSACSEHERLKVLALGGVTVSNAKACIEAGAAGVAGIRLFQDSAMKATVIALRGLQQSYD